MQWMAGAKQISMDSALPIFILPVLMYIASQGFLCTLLVFASLQLCMCYSNALLVRFFPRTKFFVVWSMTSLLLLLAVFEMNVVPLLEILPEENCVLVGLVVAALWCAHKVRFNAALNQTSDGLDTADYAGAVAELTCAACHKRVPPRAYHCRTCQACIVKRDHHCAWLDCCIGEKNHLLFVAALALSVAALTYGAILTLTSVCHPFFFLDVFLLPDDCSDVYHDLEIAVCFVSALYCLALAVHLLLALFHQCWLVSLGVTGQEWRNMHGAERRCLGLGSQRKYSRGVPRNWARFLCFRKEPN